MLSSGALKDWINVTPKNAKGSLVTTAVTANQEILTYTPDNGVEFVITNEFIQVLLTTVSTTELKLGTITVKWGATEIFGPYIAINPTSCAPYGFDRAIKAYKLVGDGVTALTVVCTPAVVTSITWIIELTGILRSV